MDAHGLRVVVADDSTLLREGMASLLMARGLSVVCQVGDGEAAIAAVATYRPDVALVDIRMPPGGTGEGLRVAARLDRLYPDVGVLIVSDFLEPVFARQLLDGRAARRGYLLKDTVTDLDEFVDAIRRVASGETVVDAAIVERVLGRRRAGSPLAELSDREHEILALIAEGLTNAGIAARLVLSERTVENHVHRIFQRLRIAESQHDNRRVLAVLSYLRD